MDNVEQFIDQLLDTRGVEAEGEVREQLKQDMRQRLLDQIDRAVINALPEDKLEELSAKLDDENFSDDEMFKFVSESGVDAQRIALETMLQFRYLYLGEDGGRAAPVVDNAQAIAEAKTADGGSVGAGMPRISTLHNEGLSR